jgi:hypothetical protein
MCYEGWTYREAVVRLAEHRELREALHLARVPHFTTLQKFLRGKWRNLEAMGYRKGHRLRPGWRQALLHHLAGTYQGGDGYSHEALRHLLHHQRVQRELPRLLEEATDHILQRLRQG